jgi:hypothetical protein
MSLANTPALAAAGAADLPGCERGPDGSPTGRVTLEANHRLGRWLSEVRDAHRVEELQLAAAAEAAARGITSVHEMSMPAEDGFEDVEILLGHRERLPVDVAVFVGTMDVARIVDRGLGAIGGDLAADGSIGARTAALQTPYVDGTGSNTPRWRRRRRSNGPRCSASPHPSSPRSMLGGAPRGVCTKRRSVRRVRAR